MHEDFDEARADIRKCSDDVRADIRAEFATLNARFDRLMLVLIGVSITIVLGQIGIIITVMLRT